MLLVVDFPIGQKKEENLVLFPRDYSDCLLLDPLLAFSAAFAVAF